ncbi:MAG: hypothetical protein WCG47_12115 [Dermatophilaceae bacterium]
MSWFGPPPGASEPTAPRRPASYLPPGGLGSPGDVSAAGPFSGSATAYRHRYAVGVAHKPGLIALKPLSPGDILDGSTKLVRRGTGTVLGLSALTNAIAVLPAVALVVGVAGGTWLQRSGISRVINTASMVGLLLTGGTVLATIVLTGLLAPVAGEAILGRRISLAEAWSAARSVLPRVLATSLAVAGVAVGPWVALVLGLVLVANAPVPVVLVVGFLLGVAALVATAWLLPRMVFAGPAVALEGVGVRAGLARASELSRRRYWPILGVSLLAVAVSALVFLFFELVGVVIGGIAIDLLDLTRVQTASAMSFVTPLSTLVSATLVSPFLAGTVILQYVDARMRKEGLDLVLLRRTSTRAGAGS